MKILALLLALTSFASATPQTVGGGPQVLAVSQDEKDPTRVLQAQRDRYQRMSADWVSKRKVLSPENLTWMESFLEERLKQIDGDPKQPADLQRFAAEKAERLTHFCAPENNERNGEWYGMGRAHCAELKAKYGVDFTSPEAKGMIVKNTQSLFAAFRAERRAGYATMLANLRASSK
jgi:hypothetical protein